MRKLFVIILVGFYITSIILVGLTYNQNVTKVTGSSTSENSFLHATRNANLEKIENGVTGVSIYSQVEKNDGIVSFRYYLQNNGI